MKILQQALSRACLGLHAYYFLSAVCERTDILLFCRNEIGGDGDVPHPSIGRARRLQVRDRLQQHKELLEAVQNHSPKVKCLDSCHVVVTCINLQVTHIP